MEVEAGDEHGTTAFVENRGPGGSSTRDEFCFLSCSCPSEVTASVSFG